MYFGYLIFLMKCLMLLAMKTRNQFTSLCCHIFKFEGHLLFR